MKAGGTLRVGITKPAGPLEPYLLNDGGALAFSGIPGEYLTYTNPQAQVVPWLATSWKANADATVWTFQIRKGVKFHNGQALTAKDVVASMKQYVGAKGSNAGLGAFFDPSGVSAKGDYTVVFQLKSPVGAFPYLLSQTTYQAIIQPAAIAAKPGTWVASGMIGTGPFKLKNYNPATGADLVRNASWWGGPPPLDGVKITFYQGSAPLVLALRAGQLDLVMQLSPPAGRAVQEQLQVHLLLAAGVCSPPVLHAHGHRPVQGPAGAPRARARDQPAAGDRKGHARRGAGRERQPVLEEVRLDRPVDQAADAEHPARQGAAGGGRGATT